MTPLLVLDNVIDRIWSVLRSSHTHLVGRRCSAKAVTRLIFACGLLCGGLLLTTTDPAEAYEGFGTTTLGALSSPLGWSTYVVTSLENKGPGTLRDAIEKRRCGADQHICNKKVDRDPANQVWGRKVVFAPGLSGTITLQKDLVIDKPYLTIDGASAEPPGITIRKATGKDGEVRIKSGYKRAQLGHHIIINNLRFVGNWDQINHKRRNNHATLLLYGRSDSDGVKHIIIDHCTFRDATDSSPDLYGKVENVTVSWNLFYNAHHPTSISSNNHEDLRKNLSFHHNVYAYTHERNPQIKHNVNTLDYTNNIVFNWGLDGRHAYSFHEGGGYGIRIVHHGGPPPTGLNFINNIFHSDRDQEFALYCDSDGADGQDIYIKGNILPPQNKMCRQENLRSAPWPILPQYQVSTYATDQLVDAVLPSVGMLYRDEKDRQLINEMASTLGGNVDPLFLHPQHPHQKSEYVAPK